MALSFPEESFDVIDHAITCETSLALGALVRLATHVTGNFLLITGIGARVTGGTVLAGAHPFAP
jgi:hypothetical protein